MNTTPAPVIDGAAPMATSRRDALRLIGTAALAPFVANCTLPAAPTDPYDNVQRGRIQARPGVRSGTQPHGRTPYYIGDISSSVVYVPTNVDRDTPAPMLFYLHGASRNIEGVLTAMQPWLDEAGVVFVASYAARGGSWDLVHGLGFLEDPIVINQTLDIVFKNWTIDPARIWLSGFSDGGTYTLALGRANGDLFKKLVSYSPGGLLWIPEVHGKPPILITHGTQDNVLSYDNTADSIVPQLIEKGYTVDFRSFEGMHAIPSAVAQEVVAALGGVTP